MWNKKIKPWNEPSDSWERVLTAEELTKEIEKEREIERGRERAIEYAKMVKITMIECNGRRFGWLLPETETKETS